MPAAREDTGDAADKQSTCKSWAQLLPLHLWQAAVLPLLLKDSQQARVSLRLAAFRQTSKVSWALTAGQRLMAPAAAAGREHVALPARPLSASALGIHMRLH